MTIEKISPRQFWILFSIMSLLLVSCALFEGRAFIFGPAVLETSDFAANGIRIFDAGHFNDLWGNYSRWGFSHPGPFFFYLYSLGEKLLFNLLKVVSSPHQAHIVTGTIFQSLCISLAICVVTLLTRRRLTLYICVACAAFIFPRTLGALTSIWPPHVLLGPYILLIVSCAALSLGYRNLLPVAVFVTCVLCHGHVAQPLMTLPMLGIAVALYFWNARTQGETALGVIRTLKTPLWISLSIIAVFLAPLLIDLTHCPDCNAYRIRDYMRNNHDPRPRIGQAFNYVFSYLLFDHSRDWLDKLSRIHILTGRVKLGLALTCLLLVLPRLLRNRIDYAQYRALKALALFTVVAIVLSLIWAMRITGPLYEFNAFFIYGIMFVGACVIATAFSLVLRDGRQSAIASVFVSIAIIVIVAQGPVLPVFSSPYVLETPNQAKYDAAEPSVPVLINQDTGEDWPVTTALGLWFVRHNVDFMVPANWAYVFGWEHTLDTERALRLGNRLQIWEPGDALALNNKHIFELSTFCNINASSPLPEITAQPMSLSGVRSKCELAAVGLQLPRGEGGWTNGHFIAMQFVGRHVDHPVQLNFDVYPFLGNGKLTKQAVHAYVNGSAIGDTELTSERLVTFSVPSSIWNTSKVITLALVLPDATSPKSLGMSEDARIIGLGFKGMGIQYDNADLQSGP
jgi:hypothetical protein